MRYLRNMTQERETVPADWDGKRARGLGRESSWETKLELLTRIELARMDRASD